jgi:predicted kinase
MHTSQHGHLVIVCGLPGSGKTTLAKRIEAQSDGVRMSPDDWMDALGINLWQEGIRDRIEKFQWDMGKKLLRQGVTVIIEWGTWGRDERDLLRTEARAIGASVELHYLTASVDVLFERIQARDMEDPPITRADVEGWAQGIQIPDAEEFALYDAPRYVSEL